MCGFEGIWPQTEKKRSKREWLSWWSTTLPRSGSRVRVPSRAFFIYSGNLGFIRSSAVFLCSKKISFSVDKGRQLSLNGQKDGKIFVWQNGSTRIKQGGL